MESGSAVTADAHSARRTNSSVAAGTGSNGNGRQKVININSALIYPGGLNVIIRNIYP